MSPRIATLAILAILALGVATPASGATRFLVAVGARTGLPDEDLLIYANSDAERLHDTFVELGAVAPSRATLIEDGGVHGLELAIARLQGEVAEAVRQGERVEVIFYASSHGDADALHMDGARYPLASLTAALKDLPADAVVLILDACRTATSARGRDKGAVRGPAFDVTVSREVAPRGFVTLYAARDGEAAQESDALEGAYFTHHLIVGLRGAADFDGDKKVTLAEAWRHAHQTTLARSHATSQAQHPEMTQDLAGEAELVLVDLLRARATLVLPPAVAGELLLVDAASGRVLFEVQKTAGREVAVALPARRVRAQLRPADARDTVRIGEIDLSWGGSRSLDPSSLAVQPLDVVAQKGGGARGDTTPWIASVSVGPAFSALGVPWVGADAMFARRLLDTPVLLRARVGGARADVKSTVDGVDWQYVHVDVHGAAGAEVELFLWAVRLAAGADIGTQWLMQEGARTDAARLNQLGYAAVPVSTWALGPRLSLDATLQLPIAFGFSALAGARAGGAVLSIDGAMTPLPDAALFMGGTFEW